MGFSKDSNLIMVAETHNAYRLKLINKFASASPYSYLNSVETRKCRSNKWLTCNHSDVFPLYNNSRRQYKVSTLILIEFIMKVNEKNLIAIANASNLVVDKEGWLNKRGESNKGFQKRWFVLKGNLLYYFEKKTDKEPVGVVIVEGCTVGE